MEALFLNPGKFDLALGIIETFVKEIFHGEDQIQKLKLSEKLQNLLDLNYPGKSCNSVQNLEVNSTRQVELPDELWLKIIQYMSADDVFGNFALSCKKFQNLSQDPSAIKYLQVKTINTWSKYESVNKVITRSKALVKFTINKGGIFDNELICQAFESNPSLRTISIKTKSLKHETIDTIAKSKIEVLDLYLEEQKLGSDEMTALCNIKTLKSLRMNLHDQILTTLANNSTPIEALDFATISGTFTHGSLNEFFRSKKDSLKSIALMLQNYRENESFKNLNLCQNLEKIRIFKWHSKHLEILSGMPNLKYLMVSGLDANVDTLITFFRRLSLKKLEYLSIQYCQNAKEEFYAELSKLDFPMMKKLTFFQTWNEKIHGSKNLTGNTLQTLLSKCPNLKYVYFGDNFGDCDLSYKTMMDIFEKRNIFMSFGQAHSQYKMEQWFLNKDRNVYENYQKLKPIHM